MVTISSLRSALCAPKQCFRRMSHLRWCGQSIVRSTYFAECEVECDGARYRLFMPLSSSSLRRVERFIPLHRELVTVSVPRLEILRGEMMTADSLGREHCCDILREPLPEGESLSDAVAAIADEADAERLVEALNELQGALLCVDVSHNAVREDNVVIDRKGRAHLIRWYYATAGAGGDAEAFDLLRDKIASRANNMLLGEPMSTSYNVESCLTGHLYVRPMHEGLAAVEDESGWGFVDSENRVVIAARYVWVGNFSEGRVEIETESGMGVIDRRGEIVVEPIYDSVEYDCRSGCTRAWRGEQKAIFDYEGQPIESADEPNYPPPEGRSKWLKNRYVIYVVDGKSVNCPVPMPYGRVWTTKTARYA